MAEPNRRLSRLQVRVALYALVIAAIFVWRAPSGGIRGLRDLFRGAPSSDNFLRIAGLDLAPVLIPKLVEFYSADYPSLQVRLFGGGTTRALEELINKRSDVAFSSRPPSASEQTLFRGMLGDTAIVYPIALGGIALLVSERSVRSALAVEDLHRFLEDSERIGDAGRPPISALYAPDPNTGLWDALAAQLGVPAERAAGDPRVVFLAGETEVFQAVAADAEAVGIASTLALPMDLGRRGVRSLPMSGAQNGRAAAPADSEIATGDYPLYHYLYVSCRPDGGIQGSKFVTHLTSGRGQRQVERAGFLPAKHVGREIVLTTHPLGQPD